MIRRMQPSDQVSQTPTDRLWTPANIVTLLRICLVPLFVVALISPWPAWFGLPEDLDGAKGLIAAGIFIIISCTDWLDGYLARSRGEVTDFGKFMDPLADKILVAAALLALVELGALPSWVVLIILAREFIVSGVRMVAASEGIVIAASWYGKLKTVFQMIAIVLFTIKDSYMVGSAHAAFSDWIWLLSWTVMIIALVLTIVSMLDYIAHARHLIGFDKRRAKKARNGKLRALPDEPGRAHEKHAEPIALELLACQVLDSARKAQKSVATAESLTGGLIAATLTEIPGSSEVVRGGVISYVNDAKHDLLNVAHETLAQQGAVSKETACAMAQGARRDLRADVAVAVTGIAGPGGAEPGKPVGTVWFGLADAVGTQTLCRCFRGDRSQVRLQTVRTALELLQASLRP